MSNNELIALAFLALGCLIGGAWLMLYRGYKQYERESKAFEPRIQTPAQKELSQLRAKQAAFDAGDDRELPMLLKRNAP